MVGISDFYRGDTKKYKFKITDKESSAPICIDGGLFTFTMKSEKDMSDADADLQVSTLATDDCSDPTGEVVLTVPASETNTLIGDKKYYYDFQYVSSVGEVTTILAGKVKVLTDITRTS